MPELTPTGDLTVGRLPMSDEELRLLERNRLMTRRVLIPLMTAVGACGIPGGIWAISTNDFVVGIGLVLSALIMLCFAGYFIADTRKPVERPEKFFVTGIVTSMKKTGGTVTRNYYSVELNERYQCFTSEEEFQKIKIGDAVMCERLEEGSDFADRIVRVNH